ncbi:PREDICTED: RNA-binding protein 5-like isoform X2 [Nicrophorus vespilloides]|uniref:RNA-binding protein 5-like isoform X2 n=1 Tax=Nicrophorus vespilloides TaxID=110193 RepID=A0ABM1NF65_NICVS|nr:PREDICTED: RNA-binding protein 5-like isoform X2 [Nicrophorus vespilloides]
MDIGGGNHKYDHERSPLNDENNKEYNNRRERESSYDDDRRSRSTSREREYRDRDRDSRYYKNSHKDYRRSRSSGSGSRWDYKDERSRDRDRYRDRDRDNERDSDDSERSSNGGVLGASGSEIIGYKSQPPNNTIMIRGLAQHITENDIRQDIIHCGLMPKDIRLIRKKDTGASRGFAFVEFTTLSEATRWMDMKQGILMLQDQYRAIMQYSMPKELCPQSEKAPTHKASADWFCIKCGAQNFKRRELCFKCHASRMESEEGGSGSDEICSYTTKTIMLRNLDALTTEDTVMNVLIVVIPDLVKKISAVAIGRDSLTSTSRGICYLGTETTIDALSLYGALNNLPTPLSIDGKTVILSYCKYNMGDTKHVYAEPESTFATPSVPTTYNLSDVDSLADYSANKFAKNSVDYQHYFLYYKNYFTQQINAGNSITLHQENQMDAANAAAAVAQSAIQQMQANKTFFDTTHMSVPNGTDGKRYPIPDITKYTFDKNSGYYYDQLTGLYYDQSSQYYWNSVIQKYLYWDREKLTYVLAPTNYETFGNNQQTPEEALQGPTKKTKVEKQDKVKVAKKIAKDMERWAKTLNQKKEVQPSRFNDSGPGGIGSAAADIGFSVLEKKAMPMNNGYVEADMSNHAPLVAAYGGESDSSEDEEPKINDLDFLDFNTLICNLCKRMLPNAEALSKHAQFSSIHKQNLENLRNKKRKENSANAAEKIVYRDRAKERRLKYGDPDEPQPSKLKEKYLKSREIEIPVAAASVSEPIGAENVGNRLLQKMGWTEGQGLGKSNQGRTTIIQAEQRASTVGLGNKSGSYQALAGESYKDCVKKMMYARYQELSEKDN